MPLNPTFEPLKLNQAAGTLSNNQYFTMAPILQLDLQITRPVSNAISQLGTDAHLDTESIIYSQ